MSCRLRNYDGVGKSPFCYGLMNLISASHDELEIFKKKCCQAILSLEPRISDIEISEIAVDSEKQEIALDILCIVKLNGEKINRKLML
jgi:predicted component of type VI protein secretion system